MNSLSTRFQSGVSGNQHGRPAGSRNRFSAQFVADVADVWERHGPAVLERLAVEEPARFADICSRLIPKDVAVSIEQRPTGLDETDLQILRAIRDCIPNAGQRSPTEVFQYVLEALNAHDAKLIEGHTENPSKTTSEKPA
jgi:hypothetical protein